MEYKDFLNLLDEFALIRVINKKVYSDCTWNEEIQAELKAIWVKLQIELIKNE